MSAKHNQIANHLITDILDGNYRVGERLPSERDLASRFQANRGAVREAMKTLQQIGLADIQPGGARVKQRNQASLDVIGHILNRGELPDREVVDQILVVINNLLTLAVEQAIQVANNDELETICAATRPFYQQQLGHVEHSLARINLLQTAMQASKNLPLQLIARSLFEQFAPNMEPLAAFVQIDHTTYASYAKRLDYALQTRDVAAVRETIRAFAALNRESLIKAYSAAQSAPANSIVLPLQETASS